MSRYTLCYIKSSNYCILIILLYIDTCINKTKIEMSQHIEIGTYSININAPMPPNGLNHRYRAVGANN